MELPLSKGISSKLLVYDDMKTGKTEAVFQYYYATLFWLQHL